MDHKAIIRYWERRRWLFLLLLIPPAAVGYGAGAEVSAAVGDHQYMSSIQVLLMFVFAFIAANLCYTFVYAIEFLLQGTRLYALYAPFRFVLLMLGCAVGMVAAFVCAMTIYNVEYNIDPATGRIKPWP